MTEHKLVLASHSPRRIEMLTACGLNPQVVSSRYEEVLPGLALIPPEQAMFFALGKALDVANRQDTDSGAVVVGADTIVVMDGEVMGKPKDKDDGFRMLTGLRNRAHQVITGVCLVHPKTGVATCFAEESLVYFGDYTDEELLAYLDTDEPYDKAGGYAIQETFGRYITHTEGSVNNIIGFPLERFQEELARFTERIDKA